MSIWGPNMIKGAKAALLYQVEGTVVWKNGATWCILNGWSITGFYFPSSGKAKGATYLFSSSCCFATCIFHSFLHLRSSWFLTL
jgi:CHASE2 domain-containing sensor protein